MDLRYISLIIGLSETSADIGRLSFAVTRASPLMNGAFLRSNSRLDAIFSNDPLDLIHGHSSASILLLAHMLIILSPVLEHTFPSQSSALSTL